MNLRMHPLTRTAQDLRRSISRIESYKLQHPEEAEKNGTDQLMRELRDARNHIPSQYRDADLKEEAI